MGDPARVNLFTGFNGGESTFITNIALSPKTTALRINASNEAYWSVVFYDAPQSDTRDGYPSARRWQLGMGQTVASGRDITDLSRFPVGFLPPVTPAG